MHLPALGSGPRGLATGHMSPWRVGRRHLKASAPAGAPAGNSWHAPLGSGGFNVGSVYTGAGRGWGTTRDGAESQAGSGGAMARLSGGAARRGLVRHGLRRPCREGTLLLLFLLPLGLQARGLGEADVSIWREGASGWEPPQGLPQL